uniref:ATP-grasp domain-containing protein n=1 Tax=Pyrodinium bahamense TaxID=73915 RepID=A0A7S0ANV6_9DINO|mmetsp:Transcript_38198/g.106429  ORF Transcript_38198/g.106429 Transcript_38198/m.106429 type:complete len:410 (+) Transcript_38198:70-1299(+)|eukprot:CAMPEP_0179077492 /NCGR_PEP_ID=MMETSP0796-20121207/34642_1 /TAXON_ID=73915 /ORGANISM="Pyrodinium bahamense, Strain pbaha01" /LENGTH=409 /DNA_ID=CAMNT_0020774773 /DNA_START=68 /DNA_END=1297 /DNA_ORIENTATION=+
MPKIRVGFICGKDTDFVEHPGKGPLYSKIGDPSFLADMPDKWRVDPASHEYLMDCEPGTKGQAHCDVALAWYIGKKYKDIEVDIITPEVLSLKRLQSNDLNFTLGYNAVNISVENNASGPKKLQAFKKAANIFPTWEIEDFILYKSKYMQACMDAGVPMAPTIFAFRGRRSPTQLMKQIKARGWKTFVMKQSESGFCLGFLKLTVEQCEADPEILKNYFNDYAHCPEFIVQEAIEGFTRNWETRCFWFNGKFLYAIANIAAVSTKDQKEHIVTGKDIPKEFLKGAKKIGKQAIKVLPYMKTPGGKPVQNVLVRTDIGCSDSQLYDRDTHWDPKKKTFFLNEIEPSSTTYFVRWLKFDCIPMYAKLYAAKAREIYKQMQKGRANVQKRPSASLKHTVADAKRVRKVMKVS